MKKFEEAELNVLMVENSVICTSGGCTGAKASVCTFMYDSETDKGYTDA